MGNIYPFFCYGIYFEDLGQEGKKTWEAAQIVLNIKTVFDKTPHEKETIFSGSDHISAIWKYLFSIANLYFSNIRTAGGKLITYILYFRRNNLVFSRPFLQKISLKSNLVTYWTSCNCYVWECQETHETWWLSLSRNSWKLSTRTPPDVAICLSSSTENLENV